jgi:hypothetical protein
MKRFPLWALYSWWVFALTGAWLAGLLPFSPLASALATFTGSIILFATRKNFINFLIVASHLGPVWLMRRAPLDIVPNVITFFLYNIILEENSLDLKKVYESVLADPPLTVRDYLKNRVLSSPGPL